MSTEAKRLHDVRLCNNQYEIGDLIYVNKMAKKVGKCPNLEHVWEGPFIIVKKKLVLCSVNFKGGKPLLLFTMAD